MELLKPGLTLSTALSPANDLGAINRNANATYAIPTENEWYKAAYYKGGSANAGYWLYPTKSNTGPNNVLSATGTNNANFWYDSYTDPTNELTPVGAFSKSPGAYGTYDQGGDVEQWTEAKVSSGSRISWGGSWAALYPDSLASSTGGHVIGPEGYGYNPVGFRVASTPEPGSISLLVAGAVCLLAYTWRRQKAA